MPQRGWSAKRERQYEHIKDGLLERGTPEEQAEEIAARTVNKTRAQAGEAETSSPTSRNDLSPSRRGGLRSHTGARGRTYQQLYDDAKRRSRPGPFDDEQGPARAAPCRGERSSHPDESRRSEAPSRARPGRTGASPPPGARRRPRCDCDAPSHSRATDPPRSGSRAGAIFLAVTITVAGVGAWLVGEGMAWYERLGQPVLNPPDSVFGPFWIVLYAIVALAGYLAWHATARSAATVLWAAVMALNLGWMIAVFGLHSPTLGLARDRCTVARHPRVRDRDVAHIADVHLADVPVRLVAHLRHRVRRGARHRQRDPPSMSNAAATLVSPDVAAQILRYGSDQEPGFQRIGEPGAFRYVDHRGKAVPAREVERIRKLAIPPAWTDVWIAPGDELAPPGHRPRRQGPQAVPLPRRASAPSRRPRSSTTCSSSAATCRACAAPSSATSPAPRSRTSACSPPWFGCSTSRTSGSATSSTRRRTAPSG